MRKIVNDLLTLYTLSIHTFGLKFIPPVLILEFNYFIIINYCALGRSADYIERLPIYYCTLETEELMFSLNPMHADLAVGFNARN